MISHCNVHLYIWLALGVILCLYHVYRDTPPHTHNDTLSEETVLHIIQNVTTLLRTNFPDVPVYPLLGNHDYHPKNQLPAESNHIYSELSDTWGHWLNDTGDQDALDTFRQGQLYQQQHTRSWSHCACTLIEAAYHHVGT